MDELFKDKGLKITKQRILVFDFVKELGDLATAKNISKKCNGKVDKSTIYRIIDLFLEKGLFEKMINYKDEIYYTIKEEHNHYFICVKCHRREKINECPIDDIDNDYSINKGYKVLNHTVLINGICSECIKNN